MNIAICEDDKSIHSILTQYLLSFQANSISDQMIDHFTCAEDFIQSNNCYDILFMDIYMTKLTGIEAVSMLPANRVKCVVFITTSKEHAIEAYQLNAIHYLLKPLKESDVHESLSRCFEKLRLQQEPFLSIQSTTEILNIPYSSITHIEASNKRTLVHTDTKTYTTYLSLDKIEAMLDLQYFMRAQRSYIVNMKSIQDFTSTSVTLENNITISLSRGNQAVLKQQYQTYLFALSRRAI